MFSTIRTAPPRIGCAMSPGRMAGTTSALDRATGGLAAGTTVISPARSAAGGAVEATDFGASSTSAERPDKRSK